MVLKPNAHSNDSGGICWILQIIKDFWNRQWVQNLFSEVHDVIVCIRDLSFRNNLPETPSSTLLVSITETISIPRNYPAH